MYMHIVQPKNSSANNSTLFVFMDPNSRLGVNLTNILCAAFTLVDPKRVKNTVKS